LANTPQGGTRCPTAKPTRKMEKVQWRFQNLFLLPQHSFGDTGDQVKSALKESTVRTVLECTDTRITDFVKQNASMVNRRKPAPKDILG